MIIILMLVGGSPSSTAGGMKTTTFCSAYIECILPHSGVRKMSKHFGRRIECSVIKNASTIAMMYCMLFLCGGITISVYEGLPLFGMSL